MGVQVHRAGTLACAELIGVRERILEQLHDRDDTRRLVLDLLDRRTVLANIAEQQCDSATSLGQLKCGVDGAADRLHVVLDTEEETTHRLATLLLAGVQERGGRRLESTGDDLVDEVPGEDLVAVGEGQRNHADTVLEPFEVALTVERLECVRGVVLERTENVGKRNFFEYACWNSDLTNSREYLSRTSGS